MDLSGGLWVPGVPRPQGSKTHLGGGRMRESSRHVKPWRGRVVLEVRRAGWQLRRIPAGIPVAVDLTFVMPRPQAHYRRGKSCHLLRDGAPHWHTSHTGDLDKLVRAVLDALTIAGAYTDDSQVAQLAATSVYDRDPGVHIRLTTLTQPTPEETP